MKSCTNNVQTTKAVVTTPVSRRLKLIRRARQHRDCEVPPQTSDEAQVQRATAPQPAPSAQLGADGPPDHTVATTSPLAAPLPERALRRPYSRQEPSALIALARICAGGRL